MPQEGLAHEVRQLGLLGGTQEHLADLLRHGRHGRMRALLAVGNGNWACRGSGNKNRES